MHDINWSTLTGSSTISNNFCEFSFQSNLKQLVNHPTHRHGNLLDLLLTNSTDNIVNLIVHPLIELYQCILSDHHLITFTICCKSSASKLSKKHSIIVKEIMLVSMNIYCIELWDLCYLWFNWSRRYLEHSKELYSYWYGMNLSLFQLWRRLSKLLYVLIYSWILIYCTVMNKTLFIVGLDCFQY